MSLKKFSKTPQKKFPIVKIKNFPPFIIDSKLKNIEKLAQGFHGLRSSLSIEDVFEDLKTKGKEEVKKYNCMEKSQNLINSNYL